MGMGNTSALRRWILEEVRLFFVVIAGFLGVGGSGGGPSLTPPYLLTLTDQTNIVVTSLTACCVLYTRSMGVAYFALGAVSCSLSVKAVKRVIRQPRPVHPVSKKKTYGMPSTHSATISHFAVYIPLACLFLPIHPAFPQGQDEWVTRYLPPLIVTPWALEIIRSRIWLGHHTWQQCAVGCAYGIAFSLAWFTLWVNGANEYGRIVEEQADRLIPR